MCEDAMRIYKETIPPRNDDVKPTEHVIFLVNGFMGGSSDWDNFRFIFASVNNSNNNLHVSNSVSFLNSMNGIDFCGEQLRQEVAFQLKNNYSPGTLVSFVGHSLGGLIIRYALGLLFEDGFFNIYVPHIFMTLATPHCGRLEDTKLWDVVIKNISFIFETGRQITSTESMQILSDPTGIYFKALALFKRRILYSNIKNDIMVYYSTSSITTYDNFPVENYQFLPNYPNVVDDKEPLDWSKGTLEQTDMLKKPQSSTMGKIRSINYFRCS